MSLNFVYDCWSLAAVGVCAGSPQKEGGEAHKERGPRYHSSALRCGEIAPHLEHFSASACLSQPSGGPGWPLAVSFYYCCYVFLVSFPGLTCSSCSSPVSLSPHHRLLLAPISPTQQQCLWGAPLPPQHWVLFNVQARGGLPSPFQNILSYCLACLTQSQQERRWKGLSGPESFGGGGALNFVFIVLSR